MNTSNLLLKVLAKVFASSSKIERQSFKKIDHRIDETSGEQVLTIEYRFKAHNATPVAGVKKKRDRMQPAQRRLLDTIKRDVQMSMKGRKSR